MVTDSIVVFVVRKGNPKNIKTWADLIKPGIQVINAEPVHLGRRALERDGRVGRADHARTRPPKQANAYLTALYKNITVQDSSARASMNTFVARQGRRAAWPTRTRPSRPSRPARTSSSCGPRRRS